MKTSCGKFLNLAHYFPYDVKLRLLARSRSFLANQKVRNAIVGAENLLKTDKTFTRIISSLTEVISTCSCWLVGRLFTGVFPGVLFLCTFLKKQNTPMIAIMMTRNPPTTAAISTVMLSVSAARPFLACALVLDSEREEREIGVSTSTT